MPSPSLWLRAFGARTRFAALACVPALFVASPARADECATDAECGFGFACETIVTSAASTGTGGSAGSGTAGTTSFGGTSSFGGGSGAGGTGVTGGSGAVPPACGNRFCETPSESPEICAPDCVYTTVCSTATCTNDLECAPGHICPAPGAAGAGGAPNTIFCGDLICVAGETATSCPGDCDPSYRRCRPGTRGCVSNDDCGEGYVCFFGGTGGVGTGGVGGASAGASPTGGVAGGFAEGGAPADPPVTGGSAGVGGGSAGAARGGGAGVGVGGGGAVPAGGGSGIPQEGTCVPNGTTGGYGGVGGASGSTDGTGNTGNTGANGPRGGNGGEGGTNGSDDKGDVVITRGGCSLAAATDHSSFAMLLVALAGLFRFVRRRNAKVAR